MIIRLRENKYKANKGYKISHNLINYQNKIKKTNRMINNLNNK